MIMKTMQFTRNQLCGMMKLEREMQENEAKNRKIFKKNKRRLNEMKKVKGRMGYTKIFVTEIAGFAGIAAATIAQII